MNPWRCLVSVARFGWLLVHRPPMSLLSRSKETELSEPACNQNQQGSRWESRNGNKLSDPFHQLHFPTHRMEYDLHERCSATSLPAFTRGVTYRVKPNLMQELKHYTNSSVSHRLLVCKPDRATHFYIKHVQVIYQPINKSITQLNYILHKTYSYSHSTNVSKCNA